MKNIKKSIREWIKKNKKEVCFIGSFVALDKEGDVKDDLMIAYGEKNILKTMLADLDNGLNKDKKKFINW